MADLCWIVPTRGRPARAAEVVTAVYATGGFADVHVVLAVDADDPQRDAYDEAAADWATSGAVSTFVMPRWEPMVPKLNTAAAAAAGGYFAVGFGGDDHLPRTPGWAGAYLAGLRQLGTGIVYGNDLLQRHHLPTQWAMTSDIVQALGRMVPAPVEHLYCDNAVMALGLRAGCIRYLPEVVVEHVHPVAGKAPVDDGYRRVNSPTQYQRDHAAYQSWLAAGLPRDVEAMRALLEVTTGA